MKKKSWHIDRRDLLKGGGLAMALPLLNGMSWAKGKEVQLPPDLWTSTSENLIHTFSVPAGNIGLASVIFIDTVPVLTPALPPEPPPPPQPKRSMIDEIKCMIRLTLCFMEDLH